MRLPGWWTIAAIVVVVVGVIAAAARIIRPADRKGEQPFIQQQQQQTQPSAATVGTKDKGAISEDSAAVIDEYLLDGLYLRGIVRSRGDMPLAVIEDLKAEPGKRIAQYRSGDLLRDGQMRLLTVDKDKVSLQPTGTDKQIWLFLITGRQVFEDVSLNQRILHTRLLKQKLTSINQLFSELKFSFVFDSGRSLGIRIDKLNKQGLVYQAGLREGDLIRAIDGERVSGISQLSQLYRRIHNQKKINLELERSGRILRLGYIIR